MSVRAAADNDSALTVAKEATTDVAHSRRGHRSSSAERHARKTLAKGGSVTLVQVAPATATHYVGSGTHEGYCYHCKQAVLRETSDRNGELPETYAFCKLTCTQRLVMHRACMNELVWKRGPDFDLSVPCSACGSHLVVRLERMSPSEVLASLVNTALGLCVLPLRALRLLVYVLKWLAILMVAMYAFGWVHKAQHYYWSEASDSSVPSFFAYRFVLWRNASSESSLWQPFGQVDMLVGAHAQRIAATGRYYAWKPEQTVSTGVWPDCAHFVIGSLFLGGNIGVCASLAYLASKLLRRVYVRMCHRAVYVPRH